MSKKHKSYAKENFMPQETNDPITQDEAVQTEEQSGESVLEVVEQPQEPEVVEQPSEAPQAPVETPKEEPVVQVVKAAPEPVQAPVEAPVEKSEYSDNLTQILALLQQTKNASAINDVNELLDYTKRMAPNKTMTPEAGAANQAGLYSTILNIIDHSGADFSIAFSAMLCIFNEYKNGAFGGAYALRFMESVPLNSLKRKAFIKMVNLLSMTANPKTRKDAMRHIDLKREVLAPFSEESRMRIESYFKG